MKKTPLTTEQHHSLAERLHKLYYQTMYLGIDLQFLGKSHKLVRRLFNAHKKVSEARSDLEDVFCREHRGDFDVRVYYPGGEREAVRFEKSCDWSAVETVIEDSIDKVSKILTEILPAVAVTSRAWKTTEQALRQLEFARSELCTLRMK